MICASAFSCSRLRGGARRIQATVVAVFFALASSCAHAQFDPAKVTTLPAAIGKQFADPDLIFSTPGFAPGRQDFSTHAEMFAFLNTLPKRSERIAIEELGRSQQGLAIAAAVLSGKRGFSEELPTVMLLGLQHGNEPAGGEAALVLSQMLALDRTELLERVNVVILPRTNPDAAEKFGRESANGIDINRDHLLLRTPEARAIALAIQRFKPQVIADLHEFTVAGRWISKFGAVMRDDALLQAATVGNLSAIVNTAQARYLLAAHNALEKAGHRMADYHTASTDPKDLVVSMGGVNADTGRNVAGLRNAISLLIETRGVGIGRAHFARRVHSHVLASMALIETAASEGSTLLQMQKTASAQASVDACKGGLTVLARQTPQRKNLVFLDAKTGDPLGVAVDWRSSLELAVERERPRPCGYLIGPEQKLAVQRLRDLGVTIHEVNTPGSAHTWHVEDYLLEAQSEGQRQDARGAIADAQGGVLMLRVRTQPSLIARSPAGFYVSMDQPLWAVVSAALEPDTQSSFAANRLLSIDNEQLRRVVQPPPQSALRKLPP